MINKSMYGGFLYGDEAYASADEPEVQEANLQNYMRWPVGTFNRVVVTNYMTAYRLSVPADTEGPTMVYGFVGR